MASQLSERVQQICSGPVFLDQRDKEEQQCSPGNIQVDMDAVFGRDPQEVCLARTQEEKESFVARKPSF